MDLKPYPARTAKRHDCGRFGMLTAREIAKLSDRDTGTIYGRIARGVTGEALASNPPKRYAVERYREKQHVEHSSVMHGGMFIACRIARSMRSKDDIPTVAELRDRFQMSRATAYRWRAAWIAALGLDHA